MDINFTEKPIVPIKTSSCVVGVCGTGEYDIENDYDGILKDIIEIEYLGEHLKDVCYLVVNGLILH